MWLPEIKDRQGDWKCCGVGAGWGGGRGRDVGVVIKDDVRDCGEELFRVLTVVVDA